MSRKLIIFLVLYFLCISTFSPNGQLTGSWGSVRDGVQKKGQIVQPRVTLFKQNYVKGSGNKKSVFAGKADLMVRCSV